MKTKFLKFFPLLITVLFIATNVVYAQSCNTLKEIFENSDYCDNKKISIGGAISEVLDFADLNGSKYVFGFWMVDENKNRIRVISADDMVLIAGNIVIIDGRYYKKLYAGSLNLDDTIVASSDNIQVVLTAKELWNEILGPYGESLYIGEKLATKNESLQKRSIILAALIPLFAVGAFYLGFVFYKRRRFKGRSFEGYIENLFRKNKEWKVGRDNSYRKLRKGWVESYGDPDFVFIHRRTNQKIAVECKYKEKEYEKILWAYEDQIEHYQNFSTKEKIPVFVILGVGGRPKNPKRVFLAPLSQIKYPDVKIDYLVKFERDPKKYFSLDNRGNLI